MYSVFKKSISIPHLLFLLFILSACSEDESSVNIGGNGSTDNNPLCLGGIPALLKINEVKNETTKPETTQCYSFQGQAGKTYQIALKNLSGESAIAAHKDTSLSKSSLIVASLIFDADEIIAFTSDQTQKFYIEIYSDITSSYNLTVSEIDISSQITSPDSKNGKFIFAALQNGDIPPVKTFLFDSVINLVGVKYNTTKITPDNNTNWISITDVTKEPANVKSFELAMNSTDLPLELHSGNLRLSSESINSQLSLPSIKLFWDISVNFVPIKANPPTTASFNNTYTFTVEVPNIPDDPLVVNIFYGPLGMNINTNKQLNWLPKEPKFGEDLIVNFGLNVKSNDVDIDIDLLTTLSGTKSDHPLVSSGFLQPTEPKSTVITDLDNDGVNEILLTDNELTIGYLKKNGNTFKQIIKYPFALDNTGGNISRLNAKDITNDGFPEIFVAINGINVNRKSKIVILDGNSQEIIKTIVLDLENINSLEIADLDNDGINELISLNTGLSGSMNVYVHNLKDFTEIWSSGSTNSGASSRFSSLSIGNVDADPQLEIVTSFGKVIDTKNFTIQWDYNGEFGYPIATGDINANGIQEIIAGSHDTIRETTVYSAVSQSIVTTIASLQWELETQNVDGDVQDEIIMGFKDTFGTGLLVYSYDNTTNSFIIDKTISGHGVSSMAIGNIDNDVNLEYVGSAGKSFIISSFNGTTPVIEWQAQQPSKLIGPYIGAKWGTLDGSQNKAIFLVDTDDQDPNFLAANTRLVSLDVNTGDFTLSPDLNNSNSLFLLNDYDNDSSDEVILDYFNNGIGTVINPFTYELSVYDLNLGIFELKSGLITKTKKKTLRITDFNKDNINDIVTLNSDGNIAIVDLVNSQTLWSGNDTATTITGLGLRVANLDNLGLDELVSEKYSTFNGNNLEYRLAVHKFNESTAQYEISSSYSGTKIPNENPTYLDHIIFDYNGDGQKNILLLEEYNQGGVGTDLSMLTIFDSTLNVIKQFRLPYTARVFSTDSNGSTNSVLLVKYNDIFFHKSSEIIKFNLTSGKEIWRSPTLPGFIPKDSLSYIDVNGDTIRDLLFGTTYHMYVTH